MAKKEKKLTKAEKEAKKLEKKQLKLEKKKAKKEKVKKESYLKGVVKEMKNVVWPTKGDVVKYTLVTIFVVVFLALLFTLLLMALSAIKGVI